MKYLQRIEKIEYSAYEKYINIDLFNKIVSFIVGTRNGKWTRDIYDEIEKKCIWSRGTSKYDIHEQYKFQYLGELLERYEERIGNDIKDIRAIALAVGYAKNLLEDTMTVGTQLVDFLNKIKSLAENDIYLKGALYLFDNKKYYIYSEELMNRKYTNTEDIIFAMSVFYERIGDFFIQNRKQIIELIGKEKSISVIGNIGIYAWLIKNLYPLICNDRKKDISLLKAIIKVPTALQKEETTVYTELINNGYTKEEIAYLNYFILYYNTVPKSVRIGNSIVEEKIAVNLCVTLINSENSYEKNIYYLIRKLLEKYYKFDIKCEGYCSIKQAIKDKVNVINPITFTELYYELDENLYSFNILDNKWDIVATEANNRKYQDIFDNFLLSCGNEKEKIEECIKRYNQLTNQNYVESFLEYSYTRKTVFNLLVDNNVLFLKTIFEYILKANIQNEENHLWFYIKEVRNKKSFEFLKYLLRINKYSIKEISEFGFCFEKLHRYYGYSCYNLDIKRNFLNNKEQKILFDCVEKYIFYYNPQSYFRFLEDALNCDILSDMFKKEELRELYLSLCKVNPNKYEREMLQEKYLTPEEMNSIREQKRIKKEQREKEKLLQSQKMVQETFDKIVRKNEFESLYYFCDKYEYSDTKLKHSINIVKKYIYENLKEFSKDKEQIIYFMKLLTFMMEKEELQPIEFNNIINEYIKEEVQKNEHFATAC